MIVDKTSHENDDDNSIAGENHWWKLLPLLKVDERMKTSSYCDNTVNILQPSMFVQHMVTFAALSHFSCWWWMIDFVLHDPRCQRWEP